MVRVILRQRYTEVQLSFQPVLLLATYVLKERADVGGHEQHVSVHFHVKDAPFSLREQAARRKLRGVAR